MSGADITPITAALDNPQPAPAIGQPGEARTERKGRERTPFPPDCPVTPLGIKSTPDGKQTCYYLDVNKQLVGLEANNRHGKNGMVALLGGEAWLEEHFPKWSKPTKERPSEIIGWDQAEATAAFISECVRRGIFTAANKMRGNGAHRHNGTGLVLHCGDKLLVSEHRADGTIKGMTWTDPGVIGPFVYPGGEKVPRPWHEEAGVAPARTLMKLVMTWNWRRPRVDPRLFLGAVGASLIGGALQWRPNVWITGGRGTGKSTLNGQDGVLHQLLGEGLFRTGNASAAAIRQSLQNATVPVLFDEIEAAEDNRKVREVVELARVASSGDKIHRGGQDHSAHEFTLRSLFWFSSINIPPLQPQDRSRLAILELQPFGKDAGPPPVLADYHLPVLGRQLLRRMIDCWPRLEATKVAYHGVLAAQGHDGRACDQFGTLLACADVLLHDHDTADGLPDMEDLLDWADQCRPERMREITADDPDHVRCLNHLTSAQVQARGGDERVQLASWIGGAVAQAMDSAGMVVAEGAADDRASARLQNMGLKVVNAQFHPEGRAADGKTTPARWGSCEFKPDQPGFLAIAKSHQGLAPVFSGQVWAGIWGDTLARFPDALECQKVKFGRASLKAVLVPLHHLLDAEELPASSAAKAVQAWLDAQKQGAEG